MAGTVAFSIVAAVAIFMVLPYFLSSLMKPVVPSYHLRTVIEGFVRIGIFIIYIFTDLEDGRYSENIYVSRCGAQVYQLH